VGPVLHSEGVELGCLQENSRLTIVFPRQVTFGNRYNRLDGNYSRNSRDGMTGYVLATTRRPICQCVPSRSIPEACVKQTKMVGYGGENDDTWRGIPGAYG
jgi:hypothetical protein